MRGRTSAGRRRAGRRLGRPSGRAWPRRPASAPTPPWAPGAVSLSPAEPGLGASRDPHPELRKPRLRPGPARRGGSSGDVAARGAGRGAAATSAPGKQPARAASVPERGPSSSRQQAPLAGTAPAAGLGSSPLTSGRWRIAERASAALSRVQTRLPDLQDELRPEAEQLSFRRKWRVLGSSPAPPNLSGCGRGYIPRRASLGGVSRDRGAGATGGAHAARRRGAWVCAPQTPNLPPRQFVTFQVPMQK